MVLRRRLSRSKLSSFFTDLPSCLVDMEIRHAERFGTRKPWLIKLLGRRHPRIAAIALANKIGRIAWALMTSDERYREPAAE